MPAERLQKVLAAAGVASRRKAEEIIAAGRVTLNGKVVTEQGTKADPQIDAICVDGQPLKRAETFVYYMLHKPKGYVTTVSDPEGRPTVMELLGEQNKRVYPVGRLDYASEGLLLMTNDGALAQKLTKAGSHIPQNLPGKNQRQAQRKSNRTVARRNYDPARRRTPRKDIAREDSADPKRRQPVVRSCADRRPQPANPSHVSGSRLPGRENQARATRPLGSRRRARQISLADRKGSSATKRPDSRQIQ